MEVVEEITTRAWQEMREKQAAAAAAYYEKQRALAAKKRKPRTAAQRDAARAKALHNFKLKVAANPRSYSRLTHIRLWRGLTISELAVSAGIDRSVIVKAERDPYRLEWPSVLALCDALKVKPKDIGRPTIRRPSSD